MWWSLIAACCGVAVVGVRWLLCVVCCLLYGVRCGLSVVPGVVFVVWRLLVLRVVCCVLCVDRCCGLLIVV